MKKFILNIPLQPKLSGFHYRAVGNSALAYPKETCFPILSALHGYSKAGEEIQVIALQEEENPHAVANGKILAEELEEFAKERQLTLNITLIPIPKAQDVATLSQNFLAILPHFQDDDQLHLCTTFGTKPQATVLTMAVQYAYRVLKNVTVDCVIYGQIDRSQTPAQGEVYDITPLLQLDQMVELLAQEKVSDPKAILTRLLQE